MSWIGRNLSDGKVTKKNYETPDTERGKVSWYGKSPYQAKGRRIRSEVPIKEASLGSNWR